MHRNKVLITTITMEKELIEKSFEIFENINDISRDVSILFGSFLVRTLEISEDFYDKVVIIGLRNLKNGKVLVKDVKTKKNIQVEIDKIEREVF